MSIDRHATQILHNEEVGPAGIVLLMYKLKQFLVKKEKVRAFLSLVQNIESRPDPRSKNHDKTVDLILESFEVNNTTYYRKCKIYKQFGLDGIIHRKRRPKKIRLPD